MELASVIRKERPLRRARRTLLIGLTALSVAAAGVIAPVVVGPAAGATGLAAGGGSLARPPYIAAAQYFGTGNPYNLWNANMANAKQAFAQMKSDGFNAVSVVVPWGEFQTHLTPPRYNQAAFSRLNSVLKDAKSLGMGVLLRVSYFWDVDPADQMGGLSRFDALWSNAKVYRAWLDYIRKLHDDVSPYGNVWDAYLSWEDLWQPVQEAQGTTTPTQQLQLASSTGYRSWLRSKSGLSLKKVGNAYGTRFASFAKVPTPSSKRPDFRLMYQYEDWALIHRLFVPASHRFPGLTLEARVDVDPLHTGTSVVGGYAHTDLFRLPGTSVTGIYDTPYMGDPSTTPTETATEAIAAMQHTLATISSKSGGRKLFMYEYQFGRDSVEIAGNPQVIVGQIPQYLQGSVPLLKQYTAGYALWTYRDYNQSGIFNPSFTLHAQGWNLGGGAKVQSSAGSGWLELKQGARASQKVAVPPATGAASTVSFEARAGSATSVQVEVGGSPAGSITVQPGTNQYKLTFRPGANATSLTLSATGAVSLTDVQYYTTTLFGNVHSVTGAPEIGAAALRTINEQLTSKG